MPHTIDFFKMLNTAPGRSVRSVRICRLLLAAGAALCFVWATGAFGDLIREAQNHARLAELEEIQSAPAGQSALPAPTPAPSAPSVPADTPTPTVLPGLAPLFAQNPDLAGWLSIEGTVIDYSVMFTPQDKEYYLKRDFDGNPDRNGSLFVQQGCDPFTPGTNIIIHGHNMKSGKMFGELDRYQTESYWREHPVICYDTLYERGEYEIIAVFFSQVYLKSEDVFKYYQFFQADTQSEFDIFVANIKRLALYDTGVDATFGDTFITLSTCSNHTENGRLVVVARKI